MSNPSVQAQDEKQHRLFRWFLYLTSIICGSLIMVIEVMGSRVIGPFFGVSIFVWTSLITVTMIALAAGYAIGGWFSDQRSQPETTLYGTIIVAGVLTLAIPLAKGAILKACMPLGLRGGALCSSMVLFGPPLLLLGCVSPFLIRIAAREVRSIGRTVGGFYAISTLGSVLGTVGTGFFLIAILSVDQIFYLVGVLLVLLGCAYFAVCRRRFAVALLLVLLPLAWPATGAVEKTMANGTQVQLIARQEGYYGQKKVVDYSYGKAHTREMIIDGLVQSGIDMQSGLSIYPYVYVLGTVPRTIQPQGSRCLMIGLGAGTIPAFYEAAGIRTDVVDIDPDIEPLARRYFGFNSPATTIIEDARYFLQESTEAYDYIILDAFTGDTTPGHLLSLEAFRLLHQRLAPGGVVAINLVGSLERDNYMTASVVRTIREVFPQVDIYPVFDPNGAESFGNIAIFAHASKPLELPPDFFLRFPVHKMALAALKDLPRWRFEFPAGTDTMILTDARNPIDCYDLWLKERVRRNIIETTDWDILLL